MSLMVEAKIAAPLSTSCLQRWTLLQEAAQCSGVLEADGKQSGTTRSCVTPPSEKRDHSCVRQGSRCFVNFMCMDDFMHVYMCTVCKGQEEGAGDSWDSVTDVYGKEVPWACCLWVGDVFSLETGFPMDPSALAAVHAGCCFG